MDDVVVLRRSIGARLFSGFWLQSILTLAVVLVGALVALLGTLVDARVLFASLPLLVLVAVWGRGVTGYARVDGTGPRWRYFRVHAPTWGEVESIRFGSVITAVPGASIRPAIFVRAHGVEHPIVAAYDVHEDALLAFAAGLAGLATAHHVPVEAGAGYWDRATALPGAVRVPHAAPGRVVSRDLRRLRMRLTGLACVVVAGCAWAGAFFGWQTPGVGERVAFGIVGLVLLAVGLLLIAVPGN